MRENELKARQKRRFKRDPANRDRFISTGLWSRSRHPNYLGEIVAWVGVALVAAPTFTGWQWVASLGPRTCSSCWAQHGSIHPADEPGPLDHHQGRCARVPLTRSWRDLGFDVDEPPSVIPDAQATFDAMGRDARRQVLGGKGLAAYEQGRFPMSAWSVRKDTPEWRPAYYAAKPPTLTPRRAVA